MDQTTADRILAQYQRFPYPSIPEPGKSYSELANLMKLFELDSGYTFCNKRVLDVGTGTGMRLLQLARVFDQNEYFGLDSCASSIDYARSASGALTAKVEFQQLDVHSADIGALGQFDVIFCMGVLHHLEAPAPVISRISSLLKPDGVAFLYLYGEYGSNERMRRKRILQHLHPGAAIEFKIEAAKLLEFTDFPYGWQLQNRTDIDAMIVDAYINQFETLYTLQKFALMLSQSVNNFEGWGPYGFALEKRGVLVETRDIRCKLPLQMTVPSKLSAHPAIIDSYLRLSKKQQLLLLEDCYLPGGYTIVLRNPGFASHLGNPARLVENTWRE